MDLTQIREHWESAGHQIGDPSATVTPTSRDPYLAVLERQNVLDFLRPADRALEIGCGIGTHTLDYARATTAVVGMDVADSLIQLASEGARVAGIGNVEYCVCSVLELISRCEETRFDVVVSQRCLINLPTWEDQQEALRQCAAVLKPGGRLLLSEGFDDELEALNAARWKLGLSRIEVVAYNHNFRRAAFEEYVSRDFEITATRGYGAYLFISRVVHPLAVAPEAPVHDGVINRAAMQIAQWVDLPDLDRYSYNRFYVLMKR